MATYFTAQTLTFLSNLAANNNREWFADNKKTYETAVKIPAKQFFAAMVAAWEAEFGTPYNSKIFRIHRDIRFSRDKTPYNTHIRMSFTPSSSGDNTPAWMMGIEMDHLVLGMGLFGFDKDGLIRFRDRVAGKPGERLAVELEELAEQGLRIGEPDLKRVPPGYDKNHERAALLRHKSLTVWQDYPDADAALQDGLIDECLSCFRRIKPVFDWLGVV